MSDEEQKEPMDDRPDEDVEAHGFDAPVDAPVDAPHATEEPPDVEGHQLGGRPVDAPVD